MKILVKVFYNSIVEALVEILAKSSKRSLRDLLQVLVTSLWKSFKRGLAVRS